MTVGIVCSIPSVGFDSIKLAQNYIENVIQDVLSKASLRASVIRFNDKYTEKLDHYAFGVVLEFEEELNPILVETLLKNSNFFFIHQVKQL